MSLVVSNTSPLTNLAVIGRLELVRTQLTGITVPEAVWREVLDLPHCDGRSALLTANRDGWLNVVSFTDHSLATTLRLAGLDAGESEVIALAVQNSATSLLIDERKGRAAARKLGMPVTGALAILAMACRTGAISSVKADIDRLRSEAGFFISSEVEAHTLRLAGEL